MLPALVVAATLVLVAVALLAFQRGYLAARRDDDARVRLLVDIVADAMTVVGDRSASDAVVRRLADALDADATAVGYVDGGRLRWFGTYGHPDEDLTTQAWDRGTPIVARNGLYVPGKSRGRVAIVVAAESNRRAAYSAKDVLLVAPLADLLASMLESRRMLREAEQLEERLLTLVGHEMRTPLTTISGTVTTLRQYTGRLDDAARTELLDACARASRRLERLVETLLMAARLDTDDVTFRRSPVLVLGVVAEAVAATDAVDRVAVDVPLDLAVTADTVHLGTVVHHLVENAVVHGGDGPVEVVGTDLGDGTVSIEVRDSGPGIPEEEQQAVLGRFRRIGGHAVPGTGLGLYLARRLVEGMDGELVLQSVPGAGTNVAVRLPVASGAAVPAPRAPVEDEQQLAGRGDVAG